MIVVEGLTIQQGAFRLEDVSLHVPSQAYAVLMGKSGGGKTTVLESVCGLRRIERGTIRIDGRDVTRLHPGERGIGYVPQDRALFPTFSVRHQIAFSLVLRRRPEDEIARRVDELAALLGIRHLLDRSPDGLSGGESQRVALGRALAAQPRVLCLDEPLSALDEPTHEEICALLADVHAETHVTVLHVTHGRREAERLATHLYTVEDGVVRENGRGR